MKTLKVLFTKNPGYTKWGNSRIAKITGLKETTILKYKTTEEYRNLKRNYISTLTNNGAK
jgi:hypothetical protein